MKGRSRQEDAAVKETIEVVKEAIANPNEVEVSEWEGAFLSDGCVGVA